MEIIVVDEQDQEIGTRDYKKINYATEIYRVSAAWVTNGKGEVLIAQRAFTKSHSPGCWGPSAAGTIEVGETYDQNIVHELAEEIGLAVEINDLTKGNKILTHGTNPDRRYFTQWYYVTADKPIEAFVIQEDEVGAVRWVKKRTCFRNSPKSRKTLLIRLQTSSNIFPSNYLYEAHLAQH